MFLHMCHGWDLSARRSTQMACISSAASTVPKKAESPTILQCMYTSSSECIQTGRKHAAVSCQALRSKRSNQMSDTKMSANSTFRAPSPDKGRMAHQPSASMAGRELQDCQTLQGRSAAKVSAWWTAWPKCTTSVCIVLLILQPCNLPACNGRADSLEILMHFQGTCLPKLLCRPCALSRFTFTRRPD